MEQFLAYVALENVAYHFDILYGYLIPDELKDRVVPGVRIQVPFGRGETNRQGIVFETGYGSDIKKYKKIIKLLDEKPILNEEMLKIARFLKERTFCTYFEGAKVQLPTGFALQLNVVYAALSEKEDRPALSEKEQTVYDYMLEKAVFISKQSILDGCGISPDSDVLEKLISKGLVVKNYDTVSRIGNLSVKTATPVYENCSQEALRGLTEKQKNVISVLMDVGSAGVKELCYFSGVTAVVVSNLEKKGFIKIENTDVFRVPDVACSTDNAQKEIVLTKEQNRAFENLYDKYRNGGGVSLLYGITGSGKTSVFIKLIDKVTAQGKQVIAMVPEIALTPQMMAIFKGRYGDKVAIFHSALSVGERKDEYRRVLEGKVSIAIGTRSAVFAPFDNIGLIVMDEEQEHTYKSESSPRYHARDVAKFRAAYHGALLLLASATPSVETFSLAQKGTYSLESLTKRYGNAVLPDVSVIDMKNDRARGNKYSISLELQQLIQKNLEDEKQTILLINRRGYNTFVACDSCGSVLTCPSCSISLTFHRANGLLMCHYCGYTTEFTTKCSICGKERIRYSGYGTQRVEEELRMLYPQARILRLDADSAVSRHKFENSLLAFAEGEYDIMLGTQMVAKGLDFENVTVVGVINADQQMNNDDFRSMELTFDLLTQVVGRSGRGNSKGIAVIQTMTPENNIIRLAQEQDYNTFFDEEIKIRKALIYPPYCDICVVSTIGSEDHKAYSAAKSFLDRMTQLLQSEYKQLKIIALAPMPPRISKINNNFRYRMIIKCKNNRDFRSLISRLLIEFGKCKTYSDIIFTADMNPENLA